MGYKCTIEGYVFLYNRADLTIDHVVAKNQPIQMSPTQISLSAFLGETIDKGKFVYYELTGKLSHPDPEGSMFILSEGSGEDQINVIIFAVNTETRTNLINLVNQDVIVCGIGVVQGEINYLSILSIPIPVVAPV